MHEKNLTQNVFSKNLLNFWQQEEDSWKKIKKKIRDGGGKEVEILLYILLYCCISYYVHVLGI